MSESVKWTIAVSKETDLSLRTFLRAHEMNKNGISKFVEDAVNWRLLDRSTELVRSGNRDLPAESLEALIEDEVRSVRNPPAQQG